MVFAGLKVPKAALVEMMSAIAEIPAVPAEIICALKIILCALKIPRFEINLVHSAVNERS